MLTHYKGLGTLLVALFCLGTGQLRAQLLEHLKENHWASAQTSPQSFAPAAEYIGNYPCLDLKGPEELRLLKSIAKESSGTLFLVAKLKAQISEGPLLTIGGLNIEADSIFCSRVPIGTQQLSEAPFLLKVKYQNGYLRKWDKQQLFASEYLAVAELIHYKEQLTVEQSRKVESYLALKYSINITENSNPSLRDYEAHSGMQYWADKSDGLYNEEVLSLGRLDQWNWQQKQTLSADSRSTLLSLAPNTGLGFQPNVALEDGSVLVVSKKAVETDDANCKNSQYVLPWKFNFHNWNSKANALFLSWESEEALPQTPYFSDGRKKLALDYELNEGKVTVKIPLQEVQNSAKETWFLTWNPSPVSCLPLGALDVQTCETSEDGMNQVRIEIEESHLPAHYLLKDTRNGAQVEGSIESPLTLLKYIPEGQYQLFMSYQDQNIIEEVLQFKSCSGTEANGLAGVKLEKAAEKKDEDPFLDHFANDAIDLFPNPAKGTGNITVSFGADLSGTDFEIEIIDQAGKVLSVQHFTPGSGSAYQIEQLVNPGTYFIQFKSATNLIVKQVVVL